MILTYKYPLNHPPLTTSTSFNSFIYFHSTWKVVSYQVLKKYCPLHIAHCIAAEIQSVNRNQEWSTPWHAKWKMLTVITDTVAASNPLLAMPALAISLLPSLWALSTWPGSLPFHDRKRTWCYQTKYHWVPLPINSFPQSPDDFSGQKGGVTISQDRRR